MLESRQREIAAIRLIQDDLRKKLAALDERVARLEEARPLEAQPAELSPAAVEEPVKPAPVLDEPPAVTTPPVETPEEIPEPPPLPQLAPRPAFRYEPQAKQAAPAEASQAQSPPPLPAESFEMRVGRVWLVRLGVVILLTGLVFLGNLAWHEVISKFGPGGKLALIVLAGGVLSGLGLWACRAGGTLAGYGRVVVGGGLATLYYACYAAHFVEALRVIPGAFAGGVLLLAYSTALLWFADRARSQTVAWVTIVLGFYTASVNPVGGFSLFGNLLLSVIAVVLFLRRKWVTVSFLTLIGCYLSFVFWRFHAAGAVGFIRLEPGWEFWNVFFFPIGYWLVFTAATLAGRPPAFPVGARPVFFTVNNGAFFGLSAPLIAGTYPDQLWIFALVLGVVLLGLALVSARLEPEERALDGAALAQGLLFVMMACVFKLGGYQLALMLALQSLGLMGLSRWRHPVIFQIFSGAAGLLAAGAAVSSVERNQAHSTWVAVAVCVVLVAVAWTLKKQRGLLTQPRFSWRASAFVGLAALLGFYLVVEKLNGTTSVFALAGLAVLLIFLSPAVRLPELAGAGQAFVVATALGWSVLEASDRARILPWAAVVAGSLVALHWWQWGQFPVIARWVSRGLLGVNAIIITIVTLAWQLGRWDQPWQAPVVALAGLVWLVYGLATKATPLAAAGQLNSLVTLFLLTSALARTDPWFSTLPTLVVFALQPAVIHWLRALAPEAWQKNAGQYQVLLRALAAFFCIGAALAYVPQPWQLTMLAGAGCVLVAWAAWTREGHEVLIYAGLWAAAGFLSFLHWQLDERPPHWAAAPGLALLLISAALARRMPERLAPYGPISQTLVNVGALAGVWVLVGRFVAEAQGGILLTISWSVLAFVVLATGFLLKERTYRLSGLVILTASIGRIFVVDVWQLETLPRILSFLVLGVVLLALGFLYNRFAEAIRKWL